MAKKKVIKGAYQKAKDFLKQSKEVGKENIGVPLKECKEIKKKRSKK